MLPCVHGADMASQLQALRLTLCQACSSQEQLGHGEQREGVAQGMGPAVSAMFDLLVALCPAELLNLAREMPPPMPPQVGAISGGSSRRSSTRRSSNTAPDPQEAQEAGSNGGRAWARQLLSQAAGLLLEVPAGLTWQEALQGGGATGEGLAQSRCWSVLSSWPAAVGLACILPASGMAILCG